MRRRVRRHGVAAVRLLQREEEQRQVREKPPDLPPLPDLQGREFFLIISYFPFSSSAQAADDRPTRWRPLSLQAGYILCQRCRVYKCITYPESNVS